jgi:hypothetical protein
MVDVKANTALKQLHCTGLAIGELNISNNTALTRLQCHSNPNLTTLTCNDAFDFTTTHISINKGLDILSASGSVLTPSVGDLITVNFCTGVVFSTSSNGSFKIVSVTETQTSWGKYGTITDAIDENDGMVNVETVKNKGYYNELPAFVWCGDYGKGRYLPAINELREIYNNISTINSTLSANGYTSLGTGYYWSSTEYNKYGAYYLKLSSGYSNSQSKSDTYNVRAVLAF